MTDCPFPQTFTMRDLTTLLSLSSATGSSMLLSFWSSLLNSNRILPYTCLWLSWRKIGSDSILSFTVRREGNALGWYFFLKQIMNCFHWLMLPLGSLSNLMVSHLVIFIFVFLRGFLWTFLCAFLGVVVSFSHNTMIVWRFHGRFASFFKKSLKQLKRENSLCRLLSIPCLKNTCAQAPY